ncbi:MAG: hypothetical protein R3F20_12455 [Planctomycetota bacterium]
MNAVARVFVVLNLILAAGFLMAAGTFLHQKEDIRTQLEKEKSDRADQVAQMLNERAALETDKGRVQSDLDRAKATITTLESEKGNLTAKLEGEQRERRNVESTLTTLQATHSSATEQIGALKDELKELRGQVDTYRQASLDDRDKALAAMKEKADAIASRDEFQAMLTTTSDGKSVIQKQLEALDREHARWVAVYPPPPTGDEPKIDGQVLRFDAATNLVEINRGTGVGIKVGHEYDIVRGADFICTVRIDRVEDGRSVGSIDVRMPGRQPRSGDRATKL